MNMETFLHRIRIEAPAEEVFRWHTRPGAFARLTPPWEPVEIVAQNGGIADGALVILRMRLEPLNRYWVAEHRDYEEGRQFRDVQVSGPFAHWVHTHRFVPDGPSACFVEEHIEYALPFGALGHLGGKTFVRQRLDRMLTYRHRLLREDLVGHCQLKEMVLETLPLTVRFRTCIRSRIPLQPTKPVVRDIYFPLGAGISVLPALS